MGNDPSTLSREFVMFALIGAAAFFVDAGVLLAALTLGSGFYLGRLLSWTTAASFTWYLNRRLNFRGSDAGSPLAQWGAFLAANSVGGFVNYGVYAALIASLDTARRWPVLAVAAGSIAGLLLNFALSRRFVFRGRP